MKQRDFYTVDIESESILDEITNHLLGDEYLFTLKWNIGMPLSLLNAQLLFNDKLHDLIYKPLHETDGVINLNLGLFPASPQNLTVFFRLTSPQEIPQVKAFIINKTQRRIIKTTPLDNQTKKLTQNELWNTRL